MALFPLPLEALLGKVGAYVIYALIGFGFGYALEISGFGWSPKLAAQFYFRELTVLKVMFTAIIVAMVLIFAASGLGLLDYNLVWVNPTYLWPGIVGGLIMGVGFIVGGFCPGTSLVAMATLKKDGLFFSLGVLFGIFLFGETVPSFQQFFDSSYMGRFTLPELFKLPTGVVVLLVVLMALFMFWGGEHLERIFGGRNLKIEPKWRYGAATGLVGVAALVVVIGQPTVLDRWNQISADREAALSRRLVQIHPGELLATMEDRSLFTILLDVRSETDFNNFHLPEARNVRPENLSSIATELRMEPPNSVIILMSNDETAATEAWKTLQAESVANVYILEGGINRWLAIFGGTDGRIRPLVGGADDAALFIFDAALGARYPAATPNPHDFNLEFTPKIQLEQKRGAKSGGCG